LKGQQKMKTKIPAIIMAAIMILSLAACADTRHALTVNGQEIRAGEFIYMQITAANEVSANYLEAHPDVNIFESGFNLFEQEWDGRSFSTRINDRAIELLREVAATALLFEELGLSLTAENLQDARRYTESFWDSSDGLQNFNIGNTWGEFYESVGIGKESHTAIMLSGMKEQELFFAIYGEEGSEPVSEEEITAFAVNNFTRFRMINMSLENLSEDSIPVVEEMAEDFARRFEAGTPYMTLITEYNNFLDYNFLGFEDDYWFDDYEELLVEDQNQYDIIERTDNLHAEFQSFISNIALNTAEVYSDEHGFFVIYKLDMLDRPDWIELERNQILLEMKGDEMIERIAAKAATVDVVLNDAAIARYTPERAAGSFLQPRF